MTATSNRTVPFRQLAERLPYAMLVHARGDIVFANDSAATLVGVARGEVLVGRAITALFAPPYLKGIRELLLGLRPADADPRPARERMTRVDGATVEVEVETTPFVFDEAPHVQLVLYAPPLGSAPSADAVRIAERHQAELARLGALGRLAGGVAHQFNNLLAIVLARASLLRSEPVSPEGREDLAAIVSAALSGSEVVARLLGFARGGLYQRQRLDIRVIVRNACMRATGLAHVAVDVSSHVDPGLPAASFEVMGDQHQLAGALDALVDNALEALGTKGSLGLRCRRVELTPDMLSGGVEPGSFAHIVCHDDGPGMSGDDCAKAIEPYFSTRGDGRGLGLAMVHGIVARHGGVMRLTSALGQGTIVELWLPLAAPFVLARDARVTQPTLPTRVRTHQGHVLVIDDEALVRGSARRVLGHLGYTSVDAADGKKGIVLFSEEPTAFDCVLLDMRMPGMNGDVVLRELVALRPDLPVILCSGYTRDAEIEALLKLGRVLFLQKPYSIQQLQQQLDALGVTRATR